MISVTYECATIVRDFKKYPNFVWCVFVLTAKIPPVFGRCMFQSIVYYDILETFLVKREILRDARFLGIILPADFIILLSALRTAVVALALSPDAIADNAFFVAVFTTLRRDVLIAFFFAVTKILLSDDL